MQFEAPLAEFDFHDQTIIQEISKEWWGITADDCAESLVGSPWRSIQGPIGCKNHQRRPHHRFRNGPSHALLILAATTARIRYACEVWRAKEGRVMETPYDFLPRGAVAAQSGDPVPCPEGKHLCFVYASGNVVPHYHENGNRCPANGLPWKDKEPKK